MANIIEETVVVKISRIVKDAASPPPSLVTADLLSAIEMMSEQLVGDHGVVEVTSETKV